MELISDFKFIKTKIISSDKEQIMDEVSEAVANYNLIKIGKLKPRPAKELLDEL